MTNSLLESAKQKLLTDNFKLFSIILYGCGGVIFQSHFFKVIGRHNARLLSDLQECNLICIKKIGKNNIILLKHYVFSYFGLPNKCVRLNGNRLLHSAALCEMLLRMHGCGNIDAMEITVRCSNFGYFAPERTVQILDVVYNYFSSNYTASELSALAWAIARHKEKLNFIKGSEKGRTDKLPAPCVPYTDFYTLRNSDVYISGIDAHGKTLRLSLAVLATGKSAVQISDVIHKAEVALADTFGQIALTYSFDVLSLAAPSDGSEARIIKNLLLFRENVGKEDFYKKIIIFRWLNCKTHLLSGIDIEKWL